MEQMLVLDKSLQDVMLSSEDYDPADYEKESDECDKYRRKWLQMKSKLKTNEERDDCNKNEKKHNLNLPKLEIRKFDDNPKTWLAFWGQFKKIHENKSMDAETKFQYLTQAMTPNSKARGLVESYPPTENNYPKVIQTLKDRFAKDEILIEIYVCELLKLVNCKIHMSLDTIYDKFVANLQILESLGIIRGKYEYILLPMIESALPESTLLLWSKVPSVDGESKLNNLLKFLQTEVEAERKVQLARTFIDSSTTTEMVPTAACLMTETKQVSKSTAGQFIKEGIIELVETDNNYDGHYLPHHVVIKPAALWRGGWWERLFRVVKDLHTILEIQIHKQIDEKNIHVCYRYLQLRKDLRKRLNFIEIYAGKDGFTRVARLQTASGVRVRPYQRLYPLELSTVPKDWLDNIPASTVAVPQQQVGSENSSAPVLLASITRSGRTIKIPFRFME